MAEIDALLQIAKRSLSAIHVGFHLDDSHSLAPVSAGSCKGTGYATGFIEHTIISPEGKRLGILRMCRDEDRPLLPIEQDFIGTITSQIGATLSRQKPSETSQGYVELQAVIDLLDEGMIVLEEDLSIIVANQRAANLLGLEPGERNLDVVLKRTRSHLEGAGALHAELTNPGEMSGSCQPITLAKVEGDRRLEFQAAIVPRMGPSNQRWIAVKFAETTHEDTLRREHETLVSIACHEIRTSLTTVLACSELAANPDALETKRLEWLRWLGDESRRMAELVDRLLAISRTRLSRMEVHAQCVSLRRVVEQTVRTQIPSAPGHSFALEIPPDLPQVLADNEKLEVVLTNLISNAVKYSPEGGRVVISAEAGARDVVVSVRDDGIGIAPADQPQLFSAFHRVHTSEVAQIPGAGLGLYIVHTLVALMGGTVGVRSAPHQGSTFEFTLPIASDC